MAFVLVLLPINAWSELLVETEQVFDRQEWDRPVVVAPVPEHAGRQWVVAEQGGRVLLIDAQADAPKEHVRVILDLAKELPNYADRGRDQLGLLGLTFHPEFKDNRQLFLHYTALRPRRNVVSRWVMAEDGTIDPQSEQVLIEQRQPYATNNGGGLTFGPDGYLYIGIGDGGAHGDPRNHAQRLDSYLGKVLRIDVDGDGREEATEERGYTIPDDNPYVQGSSELPGVFAYGLSNPWRFSFDRETGELWLGDVGENDWEEVNRIKKGGNYGWRWREGMHAFRAPGANEQLPDDLIDPVFEYPHTEGKAIVGGYVYRGKAIPELIGQYIYADYTSGKVWALKLDEQGDVESNTHLLTIPHPSSFGEDADGELLICSFGPDPNKPGDDAIYRLVPAKEQDSGE